MSDPNPSVPPEPVDPADQTLESPGAPEDFADLGKILAIIPTYNESGNIERITARVRAAVPSSTSWSPMTTALMAPERRRLARRRGRSHSRPASTRQGRPGAAYLAGFTWGIENGFDVLTSKWMQTEATRLNNCRCCSMPFETPTWYLVHDGSRVDQSRTGRRVARSCRVAATGTRERRLCCRSWTQQVGIGHTELTR